MQKLGDRFLAANGGKPATAREMARWAMKNNLWQPPPTLAEERCAKDFADAMREQYITAPNGDRIRTKHAARRVINGEQKTFWADMFDNPTRDFMETALQQRRQQIYGDSKQLRNDTDFYNDRNQNQKFIQILLDFEEEIAEERALKEMEQNKKKAA